MTTATNDWRNARAKVWDDVNHGLWDTIISGLEPSLQRLIHSSRFAEGVDEMHFAIEDHLYDIFLSPG